MSSNPMWQVVIQKLLGTEYWVNDYYVTAPSFTAAAIEAAKIKEIERAVHMTIVGFINMRIKSVDGVDQGTVIPIGQNGLRATGTYLPLYNTARVDMAPPTGRPGRKYLRLPCGVGIAVNGVIEQASLDILNNAYAIPLQNLGTVGKADGSLFQTIRVNPSLQMRQIRRGSRRREQPII